MTLDAILMQHDVPPRFLEPLAEYARSGRLVGAELKSRCRTLESFKACLKQIDAVCGCRLSDNSLHFTDAP